MKNVKLLIVCLAFFSCKKEYVRNKFSLKLITCDVIDTSNLAIKFQVLYYTDSSIRKNMVSGIEKGQDGSEDSIISITMNNGYQNIFDDFKASFNSNLKGYRGQAFDHPFIFSVPLSKGKSYKLVLVKENKKTAALDTITCNCDLPK